jgi:RHS repeat-associated protein
MINRLSCRRAAALLTLGLSLASSSSLAQTGVSDDRVSLPDGPGSLDGLGDNASVNANLGQMSHSVPLSVPAGFSGVTPSLSLGYSSGGGQSVVGFGWSMSVPFIERMTARGLPLYDDTDRFVVDGSEQLVPVDTAEPRTYRARFEGGFVRYRWHDRGTGDEGYWTAEYSDGKVDYYGADETGTSVGTARVRSPDGVFRYLLVASVDAYGHKATYDYRYYGSVPLLDFVGWVYADGTNPTYTMTFDYEARDDRISDASGGFNELLEHRLSALHISSGATEITRYTLDYEDYATSGGASRLTRVTRFGVEGGEHPIRFDFEYSRALGSACTGVDCDSPYLVDLGSIGSNVLESGRGTLMDMNGDSLPDLIVSAVGQPHEIYLSELDPTGIHTFATPYASAISQTDNFVLTDNTVQELDYDGDGFADLVNQVTGNVLVNKGTGDWDGPPILISGTGLPAEDFDDSTAPSAADGELQNIKYFDYDGDRRIDILKTVSGGGTTVLRNLGGGGYMNAAGVEDIGATFNDDNLELADMNGDGMLDPVRLQVAGISYKLNLGRGKWQADWTTLGNSPVMLDADLPFTSLEDLNGDGIDDIVVVQADEIRYAINRNGEAFDPVQTITAAGGTTIPLRDASASVLFADMNGNGSNDVVWVDGAGNVTYLELFPVRPNLLSRIENGVGMVTEVEYSTSIEHRARDLGVGWDHPIPSPMIVVESIDTWAANSNEADEVHDLITYDYDAGYYDGAEKAWRGFAEVTLAKDNGVNQAASSVRQRFDVGIPSGSAPPLANGEPYNDRAHLAGLKLEDVISGGTGPIKTTLNTWGDCAVAGIPTTGLDFPIQWACNTSETVIHQEQRPQAEWITTRTDTEFDGWGNETLKTEHGIVDIGGAGCGACTRPAGSYGAPCGDMCLGDEAIKETTYVDPIANNIWMLNLEVEVKTRSGDDGRETLTRSYYDGDAFTGLPLGEATLGNVTRSVEASDDSGAVVEVLRARYDSHGNVVEEINANGSMAGGGRQYITYSADGADVISEAIDVTGPDGAYQLKRDYTWDPLFGAVTSVTHWYIPGETTGAVVFFGYDEFGRQINRVEPGDSVDNPTEEYRYEWGGTVNGNRVLKRSTVGGPLDIEEVTCFDGLGRELQTRAKISDGRWAVAGYQVLNRSGQPVRIYRPFESTDGACETAAPDGVLFTEQFYDGIGREIRTIEPDDDASERRVEHRPLAQILYSEDDTNASGPYADTPSTIRSDGLGRTVSAERLLTPGGTPQVHQVLYDDLGELAGYIDPDGNIKTQSRNLLGRIIAVSDPNSGDHSFEFDDVGNLLREVNGAGRATMREYDELGRKVAEYDEDDRDGTLIEFFYDKHPDCPAMTCDRAEGMLAGARYPGPDGAEVVEGIGYDARKRLATSVTSIDGRSLLFESTYDNAGRLIKETFPGGRELEYTLDGGARIIGIPGYIDSIEHDERGILQAYTLANGLRTELDYDSRLELAGINTAAGGAAVIDLGFERNRRGDVTRVTDGVASGQASSGVEVSYDALGRMLSAALNGGETISLSYDAGDRIVSKTSTDESSAAHVGAYSYGADASHAVTAAGPRAFTYSAGGFALTRGDDEYTWNAQGRIESLTRAGQQVSRWTYGPKGGLFAQQTGEQLKLRLRPNFEVRDGVGRLLVQLDGQTLVEVDDTDIAADLLPDDDGDGAIDASDAWAARSTADLGILLRSSARRVLVDGGGDTRYLHKDHLGSTVAVTDDAGAVQERFSYYPYGALRHASAVNTELAAFAEIEHDDTGLLHHKDRVYSPEDGRWLAADPGFVVLEGSGLDKLVDATAAFSYGQNNPLTFVDQGGQFPWKKALKIALAVVVVAAVVAATVASAGAFAAVAGTAAIVGASVGGVVSGAGEAVVQTVKLKNEYRGQKIPASAKLKAVASVAAFTVIGAVTGWFTGGMAPAGAAAGAIAISASATTAQAGITVAETQGRIGGKTATALRVITGLGGGLAGGGVSHGFNAVGESLKTGGVVASTTVARVVKDSVQKKKRSAFRKRGRAIRRSKKLSKALKKAAKAKAKATKAKGKDG